MPSPPPELSNDLVERIFLRLPPDEPRSLFRASLVSESLLRRLSGAAFRRRYCELHRTPLAVEARHGRVLFLTNPEDEDVLPELIVWDPVTLQEWIIHYSVARSMGRKLEGCDHLDCHGHPFIVAYVSVGVGDQEFMCSTQFYSSETDSLSDKTYVDHDREDLTRDTNIDYIPPSILVGNTLYFDRYYCPVIIRYDLADRELSLIEKPQADGCLSAQMVVENGVLGLAAIVESSIYLWSREVDEDGAAAWVQPRVIKLETLLPPRPLSTKPMMCGFAERVGVVFLWTETGIFTVELKSGRAGRNLCNNGNTGDPIIPCFLKHRAVLQPMPLIPYMSFYTPAPNNKALHPASLAGDASVATQGPTRVVM
ncbi:hypothetical protein BRADI_1g58711v3 [Brachypodium distachyon]|uniref:F-box domain-containing protein n=1 Tax=Brachypodium distachyon TaxID=15368 RepID=A0A2K2DSA9_BRADI|nr:hypothetical protein BRADI_1g58711v3 [Brachypodium distachyon]